MRRTGGIAKFHVPDAGQFKVVDAVPGRARHLHIGTRKIHRDGRCRPPHRGRSTDARQAAANAMEMPAHIAPEILPGNCPATRSRPRFRTRGRKPCTGRKWQPGRKPREGRLWMARTGVRNVPVLPRTTRDGHPPNVRRPRHERDPGAPPESLEREGDRWPPPHPPAFPASHHPDHQHGGIRRSRLHSRAPQDPRQWDSSLPVHTANARNRRAAGK